MQIYSNTKPYPFNQSFNVPCYTQGTQLQSTLMPHRCFFSQVTEGWQNGNIFFCLCLRVFVCDIRPHANLQIIERQGNKSGRLFCPLTTRVAVADAVILLTATLAVTQMRRRQTPSTFWKRPKQLSACVTGQSGTCGRLPPKTIVIFHVHNVSLIFSYEQHACCQCYSHISLT